LELKTRHRCFGGTLTYYAHASQACATTMRFGVYLPPQADSAPCPVLYYLAGLTCTEETFFIKAGAQRWAAHYGLIVVAPDTSPRATGIADENANWDFGAGAGFYVDAVQAPWSRHWRMYSYVTEELPALIAGHFPVDSARQGIFGHSMGGHGALVCGLRNPQRYRSVSAFAPIAAPMRCPWGHKAFSGYLGADRAAWANYDASELVMQAQLPTAILVDQGLDDKFLDEQLQPQHFEDACQRAGQALVLRRHRGYDHSYYFISSFIEDHMTHHARRLLEA
jgi:S-formylglutathione hydrolase